MATTVKPATTTREVIETSDRADGMRAHRYRWTVAGGAGGPDDGGVPISGDDWASEPIEPVPLVILRDRWSGMMGERSPSKMQNRLDVTLKRLADELTRRDVYAENAVIDGDVVGLDIVMDIDGLEHVIRDWMIERAAKVAAR